MSGHFRIEPSFTELFPEAVIGLVVAEGIDNHKGDFDYAPLLAEGAALARQRLAGTEFAAHPVTAGWREAFRRFKTKKGVRSSIEALLKRVANDNPVGSINPLVDLYNYISMKYALPCGGETLAALEGDLRLTVAAGGEAFLPLGAEADEPALPGEVIYRDDAGAVCRCFNWREARRTMLTEATTSAALVLELTDAARLPELEAALAELADLIRRHLSGTTRIQVLRGTGSAVLAC
jgi:DNA/RNA-binding domain of Phe-tRNA-synthetase-like protein